MNTVAGPLPQPEIPWQQITVEFTNYTDAEQITADRLRPLMNAVARSWWFIRKAPCWRLRYLPNQSNGNADVRAAVAQALKDLQDEASITSWVETIYEPEIHAFGGTSGMTVAHELFDCDCRHILDSPARHAALRREHTILLCSVLLRAAGQDWYEQGDV